MRSPAANLTALVEDIVDNLRPWKDGLTKTEIGQFVADQIRAFRSASAAHLDRHAIQRTRDSARDILKTLDRLELQINRASPEMKIRLGAGTNVLKHRLAPFRRECEAAIRSSLTEGRKDQVKDWAAKIAWILVKKFSVNEATSGSGKSPFKPQQKRGSFQNKSGSIRQNRDRVAA
jgi:hypothetical protein